MPTITHFEDIEAWKTARQQTNLIYELTSQDKFSRDFGLKDQIRRAAVSVMSSIVEGFESQTQAQFIRYLSLAKASAGEVRSQLYVAIDTGYLMQEQFNVVFDLADKVSRQLARFIGYLETHPQAKHVREESSEYDI